MTNEAPKLLPCPFCGGEATCAKTERGWKVECEGRFGSCTINARTHYQPTKWNAYDAWNTRADHALAMVAAAYEDAAEKARDAIFDYKEVVHNAIHNAADRAEEGTPDDARAALDRMLADARRDALREAGKYGVAGQGPITDLRAEA